MTLVGRLVGCLRPDVKPLAAGSNRSWPGSRSLLATSGWSGAACRPDHRPSSTSWLLVYPDTYEIGLPNQGLQILYEILNERADAVAERSYAPWVDLEARAARPPACRCSRSTPTAPAGDFDVLAFNLSAELVYTNVLELHRPGRRARCGPSDRRPEHPLVVAGGHCTFNPEPLADFVDFVRDRRRRGGRRRDHRGGRRVEALGGRTGARGRAARAGDDPRRLRAVDVRRRPTTARPSPRSRPATPTCPRGSTSAPSPTSPTGRTRSSQLVPLTEVVHDRLNVEVFRGCTRGCRFCQAGMITRPVRERPADQVRTHGARRPAPHRLRRGRAHVAVDRRLLGHRRPRRRPRQRPAGLRQRRPVAAVAAGRRLHRRHRQRDPEGPPHRAHLRARRRARGGCARSSTS